MTEPQEMSDMTEPQVPGLKAGSRTEFLVIGDVIPGHEDALRQALKEVRPARVLRRASMRSAPCMKRGL